MRDRHRDGPSSARSATVGATCLALLAGSLIALGSLATAGPAQAATIPTNPCVAPPAPPVTTRPVPSKIRVSPTVVDVRRRARSVEVTLRVTDTVAVSRVLVGVTRVPPTTFSVGAYAQRISGTATSGTWRARLPLIRGIPDGRYRVAYLWLWDVGGAAVMHHPGRNSTVDWPAPFVVRSRPDRTAPTVSDFRVSTRSVDTRSSTKTVAIRVTARDDISGVALVRVRGFGTDRSLVPAESAYHGFDVRLTQSTTHRHRWVGTVVIPTWVGVSSWQMRLNVRDERRHLRRITTSGLARRGWQSTLKVTSQRDGVDPTLTALSFAPTSVDARSGDVRVDVTYRVTDPLSGPSPRTRLDLFGLTGHDVVVTSVSGPATDRTYQGYVVVPQCGLAQQGTWSMRADLYDDAGNERWIGTAELATLGFPTELSVLQRDRVAPVISGGLVASAGAPLTLTFSEPVLMSGPAASLLRVAVDGVTAGGAWVCRDGEGDVVVCDADDAAVLTATFTPTTAFAGGDRVTVARVTTPPARIGIYDLDGVPLAQVAVDTLVG
jgi:hypothetical protein